MAEMANLVRVGVDTGGTFTDLIVYEPRERRIQIAKTLTTKPDPSQGVFRTLAKAGIAPESIETLVHGTTVATNTLIERDGATAALLTTAGFRDILKIQRVIRRYSLRLDWVKPEHLIPRHRCFEIPERVDFQGRVRTPLDEEAVREATEAAQAEGAVAIAVCYLFSFLNREHELRTREIIHDVAAEMDVSLSCEVFPLWREYERASTTAIDAYLKPRIGGYVTRLNAECRERHVGRLLLMQSNGGTVTPAGAAERPVALVRSGPAGGAIACQALGRLLGEKNLVLADMGGTSFDSGLIQGGELTLMSKTELEWGIPICSPMVDVRSIGAGGGSRIWLDSAGMLRVGPESTGSDPGPACYGRGGSEPAITDANLVVGRLGEDVRLAGEFELQKELALDAFAPVAEHLNLTRVETAAGALEIVNHAMADLIRALTIDRGLDPRTFTLVAFGGAGPLHGVDVARELGIRRVIVPVYAGAFSALGAVEASARFDFMTTSFIKSRAVDALRVEELFTALEDRATDALIAEGLASDPRLERFVEMRYDGQNWEIEVAFPDGPITMASIATAFERFQSRHRESFGWAHADAPFELVNFKVVASVAGAPLELGEIGSQERQPEPQTTRAVYSRPKLGYEDATIFARHDLGAGADLWGPAIVSEVDCTTFIPSGAQAVVDRYGNLLINTGVGV